MLYSAVTLYLFVLRLFILAAVIRRLRFEAAPVPLLREALPSPPPIDELAALSYATVAAMVGECARRGGAG